MGNGTMDYLSLCLICKDENDYLQEWLDYHILLGVDRFYIFDNGSRVSLRDTLQEYIDRGWVVVTEVAGKGMQLVAYDYCLRAYGKNTRWMGFIDTDEFLLPKTTLDLREFLKDFEAYGGLAVSSVFFGSNNHQTRPAAGQIASYTMRTQSTFLENMLIKSIVQPDKIAMPFSPHDFIYVEDAWCVNEESRRVDFQRYPNSIKKIQLNHYFCRSEEEIDIKLNRGRGDAGEAWKRKRFELVNLLSDCQDQSILDILEKVLDGRCVKWNRQNPAAGDLVAAIHFAANQIQPDGVVEPAAEASFEPRPDLKKSMELAKRTEDAQSRGDYQEIKNLSLEKLKYHPQKILVYVDLALACLKINEPDLAWQALSEAWRRAPNSYYVLKSMVNFFLRIGDYVTAEKTCKMLLEIASHDLTALAFMSEVLLGQKRYEEAFKMGLPVVELDSLVEELPDGMCLFLIRNFARYLEEKGRYQDLVTVWEAGVRREPSNVDALVQLSKAHLVNRNLAAARQNVHEALVLGPDRQDVKALAKRLGIKK